MPEAAYKETANRKSHLEYYWKVEKVKDGYTFKNLYTGLYLDRDTTKNGAAMRQSETPKTIGIEYANYPGAFNLIVGNGKTTNRYVNAQPDANSMSPYIVTWNAAKGADNSAFSFKEAKQQLEDALDAEFSLPIKKGVPPDHHACPSQLIPVRTTSTP